MFGSKSKIASLAAIVALTSGTKGVDSSAESSINFPQFPTKWSQVWNGLSAKAPSSYFSEADQAYFIEWNNFESPDVKVAINGAVTKNLFAELKDWKAANPKASDIFAARTVAELIHKYFGPYHEATAKWFLAKRPLLLQKQDYLRELSELPSVKEPGFDFRDLSFAFEAKARKDSRLDLRSEFLKAGALSSVPKDIEAPVNKIKRQKAWIETRLLELEKQIEALGPRPTIPGIQGGLVDIDQVPYGSLVCKERAPLAQACLMFLGIRSELILGEMRIGSLSEAHVFIHLNDSHSIFEPSTDRGEEPVHRITRKWKQDRYSVAIEASSNYPVGYRYKYSDASSPQFRDLSYRRALTNKEFQVLNDKHIQSLLDGARDSSASMSATQMYNLCREFLSTCEFFIGSKTRFRFSALSGAPILLTALENDDWIGFSGRPLADLSLAQSNLRENETTEFISMKGISTNAREKSLIIKANSILSEIGLNSEKLNNYEKARLAEDKAREYIIKFDESFPNFVFKASPTF